MVLGSDASVSSGPVTLTASDVVVSIAVTVGTGSVTTDSSAAP
ncbi:hypothetical protein [Candidatus Poriferisodalis sp.]